MNEQKKLPMYSEEFQRMVHALGVMMPLSEILQEKIFDCHQVKTLKKGEVFDPRPFEGKKLHFVISGLLETSFQSDQGKKYVQSIYAAGDLVGDFDRNTINDSHVTYRAISRGEVITVDLDQLLNCEECQFEVSQIMNVVLLNKLKQLRDKDIVRSCGDLTSNLVYFQKQKPDLFKKISHRKTAEYFAVTEQGLHRAKSRLKGENQEESKLAS